jgi:biofilm protein TabA
MVKDVLALGDRYAALGPRIALALRHARVTRFHDWAEGEYPLEGGAVRALVQRYQSKPAADGRWEAHRRHIDLQMVVEGEERIGVAPLGTLVAEPYDEARDLLWLSGTGDEVTLRPGDFVLLWPEDGHMPGLQADGPVAVTKVVYKIALD